MVGFAPELLVLSFDFEQNLFQIKDQNSLWKSFRLSILNRVQHRSFRFLSLILCVKQFTTQLKSPKLWNCVSIHFPLQILGIVSPSSRLAGWGGDRHV